MEFTEIKPWHVIEKEKNKKITITIIYHATTTYLFRELKVLLPLIKTPCHNTPNQEKEGHHCPPHIF